MEPIRILAIYLIFFASRFSSVLSDGDHAHAESNAASDAGHRRPSTFSSIHTTGGGQDYSSILSNISPDVIRSFASNPAVAQYLRSSGIDVGALTAADAAAEAGGTVAPPPAGGAGFDGPGGFGGGGFPGGFGGFGGGLPFFGPYKSLHVSGDYGISWPLIVKKVIVVIGGGIILLVLLALLSKGFAKNGLFYNWGSSLSEAFAGSAAVDFGPIHKSIAGSGAVSAGAGKQFNNQIGNRPQDLQLTQRVYNGLDQTF